MPRPSTAVGHRRAPETDRAGTRRVGLQRAPEDAPEVLLALLEDRYRRGHGVLAVFPAVGEVLRLEVLERRPDGVLRQECPAGDLLGGPGAQRLPENTVRSTLEDFESEDLADRGEDGEYSVASPVSVLQKRQQDLWSVLRSTL